MEWCGGRLIGNGLSLSVTEAYDIANKIEGKYKPHQDFFFEVVKEACYPADKKVILKPWVFDRKHQNDTFIKSLDREDENRMKINYDKSDNSLDKLGDTA